MYARAEAGRQDRFKMPEAARVERRRHFCTRCGQVRCEYFRSPRLIRRGEKRFEKRLADGENQARKDVEYRKGDGAGNRRQFLTHLTVEARRTEGKANQ